jgi:serine phosphatase RsbU (regulator of sigma subunit)
MATSRYNNVQQPSLFAVPLTASSAKPRRAKPTDTAELHLRVATLERERRELQQELFEAAQVQRRLSGPRRLRIGPFEIASEVFAVRHLAGDFVCAIDIGERTWIAVGDIAGKGVAAAMWFTHLVSLIRCYGGGDARTSAVMTALNADLYKLQPEPPLTSVVLLALSRQSGQVEFCNGGHPAPLLLRRHDHVERLETGGPLLGVVCGAQYESGLVELDGGDTLLTCTDGILECANDADEEFGTARLIAVARAHHRESAQALLFSALGAVQDFAGSTPRRDDISLLVLRHTGKLVS